MICPRCYVTHHAVNDDDSRLLLNYCIIVDKYQSVLDTDKGDHVSGNGRSKSSGKKIQQGSDNHRPGARFCALQSITRRLVLEEEKMRVRNILSLWRNLSTRSCLKRDALKPGNMPIVLLLLHHRHNTLRIFSTTSSRDVRRTYDTRACMDASPVSYAVHRPPYVFT